MNIKYITNVRIPTSRAQGYAIMKMCEEFASLGHSVTLYVPERKDTDKLGEPFSYYKIKRNFEIKSIFNSDLLGKTLKLGKLFYWIDTLIFASITHFLFTDSSPDTIFYTRDYLIPCILPKDKFVCFEIHDIPESKFLFKKALNKSKLFFVLNNNLKNRLIELGVPAEKIFIFASGVEIKEFDIQVNKEEARERLKLPLAGKIVLYKGHLYAWKGVETLAQVAIKMPDVNFVFVGGVEPEISNFKKKYALQKNIIIRPFEARDNMPFYLKAADVLVIPSPKSYKISSEYTSPLKMFEYMASGRPIIASSLPSLREVLNESNSLLAEADNADSFVSSINQALSNTELTNRITKQARADVEKFSWDKRAREILDIIKNAQQN